MERLCRRLWQPRSKALRDGQRQASLPRVFGLSFMEIVVLLLVAVVVIGPRELPAMLRTAGRWVTKLRRMAFDMREQSGIDDILRNEGLEKDIQQLRALLRKGTVLDALAIDIDEEIARGTRKQRPQRAKGTVSAQDDSTDEWDREYPTAGVDAYGLTPEDMDPYQPVEPQDDDEIIDVDGSQVEEDAEAESEEGTKGAERDLGTSKRDNDTSNQAKA